MSSLKRDVVWDKLYRLAKLEAITKLFEGGEIVIKHVNFYRARINQEVEQGAQHGWPDDQPYLSDARHEVPSQGRTCAAIHGSISGGSLQLWAYHKSDS